ncbi:unnamed protein product [Amoebophrya sp. A25]|nr:unnamed protein product [Amoebophrya sp. A25]|eukprot:GSA25T00016471001.1
MHEPDGQWVPMSGPWLLDEMDNTQREANFTWRNQVSGAAEEWQIKATRVERPAGRSSQAPSCEWPVAVAQNAQSARPAAGSRDGQA